MMDPAGAREVIPTKPDDIVRRNIFLNALEGLLYISSGAFVSVQTVLPALVTRLGGSNVAVGLVGVIAYFGLFLPQLFAARYVETLPWKKPWVLFYGYVQRTIITVMGLVVLIMGDTYENIGLWVFLSLYFLNQLSSGISTPGWFDFFAKLTPGDRRGRLIGIRTSLGGVGALICGLILTWLLATFRFPLSYAFAFFLAAILQFSSLHVQRRMIEAVPSHPVERQPMFEFLGQLPTVLRENMEFRNFIVSSAFLIVATMPVGFFTVYALKHFEANEEVVGQFTLAMVAIQVASALVNGYIADHYGNRLALICAAGGMLLASVWALLAPSLGWFLMVYVFLGVNLGTEVMARYNMSIDYGPARKRSTYVGLMNTVLAPFYLSGVIGGVICDTFGYAAVFGAGIFFSVIGMLLLIYKVHDPRVVASHS